MTGKTVIDLVPLETDALTAWKLYNHLAQDMSKYGDLPIFLHLDGQTVEVAQLAVTNISKTVTKIAEKESDPLTEEIEFPAIIISDVPFGDVQ